MLLGFRSTNHPQQVDARGPIDDKDDRRTLPEVFDPLHEIHGFTLDVAASTINAKVRKFFTKEQNGLAQSWAGEVVWCNPPYSDLRSWVTKALNEVFKNDCRKVVLLLPSNRTEQKFWQEMIEMRRDCGCGITTRFLSGRPRFGYPEGKERPKKGDRPPFGLVVVIIERP